MENTTEIKVQTPEEKAEEVMAEVLRMEEKRLSLVDGEELVSAYDFPADSVEGEKSHQIFLTTKRFVHVQKTTTKRREAKKVSAFLISEIDCIDSVIAHRRHINWILVVLSALFAIAGVIVGVAVTWYSYIGAGVFLALSILALVLPRECKVFSLLISGLAENRRTHEVLKLGAKALEDVDGDELESGDVEILEDVDVDMLDGLVCEIGAKVLEIKERV